MAEFTQVGVEAVVKNLDDFMSSLGKMDIGIGNLSDVINTSLGTALGNIITGGLALVKDAFVAAGSAALDFTKESVNMAASFQDQVAVLDIAAGDTVDTLGSMKDIALAVGGDIRLAGISAVGAADGMTELFKAGLPLNAIFGDLNGFMEEGAELGGALRASIDLAAASELELADAASLSAVVLSTFGDSSADASVQAKFVNDALNTMVKAADASVADVSDLAAALTNVGPTASAAGFDLTEVSTALAVLSTRGIAGAQAGTALKSALANMRRPTAAVQGELKKWGIEIFTTEGEMKSMVEIIGEFQIALGDATEEQKAQAIQTIAGTFGMNAMNALLDEGIEGWAKMQKAMDGAATIQEQAAAKTATFTGIQEALEGTIETLKIQIGDALLPVLSDLSVLFTEFASNIGPFVVKVFESIGEKASDIFDFFKSINFGALFDDLLNLDVSSLLEILSFAGIELGIPDEFINSFLDTFETIFNWLTVFIPLAIQTATNFWETTLLPALQQVWSFIITTLIPVFQAVWSWLSQLLTSAIGFLVAEWEQVLLPTLLKLWELWTSTILPALTELWTWLQEVIPSAIQTLTDFWTNTLLPVLVLVSSWISENLLPVFATIVAWLIENIPTAVETLAAVWTDVLLPAIMEIWTAISENFIPVITELWTWLQENLPGAIESLKGDWENVLKPALETIWSFITDTLIPAFVDIETFFIGALAVAIGIAGKLWTEVLLPAISVVWDFITNSLIPIFMTVVDWLSTTIPNAIVTVTTFWEETLMPALTTVWTFINESLLPLWEALVELFNVALTLALTAITGTWENVLLPALTTVWEFLKDNFMPIITEIKDFIKEFLEPAFTSFVTNGLEKWNTSFTTMQESVKKFIDRIATLKDKLLGVKLPPWAKPGSPPPLFYALQDINRAMNEMSTKQLPKLGVELQAIDIGSAAIIGATSQAVAGPTMAAQSVMQTTVNINQSNNINSGMGQAAFQQSTLNSVNRALALGTG